MGVLAVASATAACSDGGDPAAERGKVAALRADPIFEVDVPGGVPRRLLYNGGHGGTTPTSARAWRVWTQEVADESTFLDVLRQARAAGVAPKTVLCSSRFAIVGTKAVGSWVATALITMARSGDLRTEAELTIEPGSQRTKSYRGPPEVGPDCSAAVRSAALAG
ncbi:MAG: hypothetical protein JWN67_3919 [Actinomycetia bacterium]|nr:hypothetical protein [Actinomycetes bacterium]